MTSPTSRQVSPAAFAVSPRMTLWRRASDDGRRQRWVSGRLIRVGAAPPISAAGPRRARPPLANEPRSDIGRKSSLWLILGLIRGADQMPGDGRGCRHPAAVARPGGHVARRWRSRTKLGARHSRVTGSRLPVCFHPATRRGSDAPE